MKASTALCCSAWFEPIGLSNCTRVFRCSSVIFKTQRAIPNSSAACAIRATSLARSSAAVTSGPLQIHCAGASFIATEAIQLPSTRALVCTCTPAASASSQCTDGPSANTSHPLSPAPGTTNCLRPSRRDLPHSLDTAFVLGALGLNSPACSCQANPTIASPAMAFCKSASRNGLDGSASRNTTLCTPAAIKGSGSGCCPICSVMAHSSSRFNASPPDSSRTRIDVHPCSHTARQTDKSKPGVVPCIALSRTGVAISVKNDLALSEKAAHVTS